VLDYARSLRGPIVVVGRPRSGTRMLAQILIDRGVFCGDVSPGFLDSMSWCTRFVVPLVTSRWFPRWPAPKHDPSFDNFVGERIADTLERFFAGDRPKQDIWGWKFPETLFVMPLIHSYFPNAQFIHLIRDARDVVLSERGYFQLTAHHGNPPGWDLAEPTTFRDFCLALTFGDPTARRWNDVDLRDRLQLSEHRFTLQMLSWMHCVRTAREYGRTLGDHYLEVRYEDLCEDHSKVGKWRNTRFSNAEARDFERAVSLGAPLLAELGYL
jgi:hypothetical protein